MQTLIKKTLNNVIYPFFIIGFFAFLFLKIATESIEQNLWIIGFLATLVGLLFYQFIRMSEIIRKKDQEIEQLLNDDPALQEIKSATIKFLREVNEVDMKHKKRIKTLIFAFLLTFTPILIYLVTFYISGHYFDIFAGQLIYTSKSHYLNFQPLVILDLLFFIPPVVWIFAIRFCVKNKKRDEINFLYSCLIFSLLIISSIFFLYSLWIVFVYFIL